MHDRPAPRLLMRLALAIHNRLTLRRASPQVALPHDTWDELCRIVERLRLAQQRSWQIAAESLSYNFESTTSTVIRRLQAQLSQHQDSLRHKTLASPQEIFQELWGLYEEFSEVQIEAKSHRLIVVTDEIRLQGRNLGRFKIGLYWELLGASQPYDIVAVNPSPAVTDSSTTHPHVRDNSLCEGAGQSAICQSLQQGRLLDFFVLVRQILETYNPASAFVRLSHWDGAHCRDCGSLPAEDDATVCDRCHSHLCCDCSYSCTGCSRTCCSDCHSSCDGCPEAVCSACLESCMDCDASCCTNCLTEDRCQTCHQKNLENQSDENSSTATPPEPAALPDASLQSSGLGQTVVPA